MNTFFEQHAWMKALCWTFLHSIWQGMLIALVAGILLMVTRKRSSRIRYNAMVTLFMAFLLIMAGTFLWQLNRTETTLPLYDGVSQTAGDPATTAISMGADLLSVATVTPLLDKLIGFFDQHITTIFLLWMVFFVARMVKLVGGFAYLQRVRSKHLFLPPAAWNERFRELHQKLAIKRAVQLFESGMVKVPVVIGLFKPMVLVPVGMFSGLPANEIEAILLHELAHIKRTDYLVNLLQQFVESALFFNPAILWFSSVIREERENCCDDLAIGITNNKIEFVNALVSFQEYASSLTDVQLALVNRKYPLLNRVQRIISSRNHSLNAIEKCLLTIGLCLFVLLSFVMGGERSVKAEPSIASFETKAPVAELKGDTTKRDTVIANVKPATPVVKAVASSVSGVQPDQTKVVNATATAVANNNTSVTAVTSVSANSSSSSSVFVNTNKKGSSFVSSVSTPVSPTVEVNTGQWQQDQKEKKGTDVVSLSKSTSVEDDGQVSDEMTVTYRNGNEYTMKRDNGKITELVINGKKINAVAYTQYQKEVGAMEDLWKKGRE